MNNPIPNPEQFRLEHHRKHWMKWGPYLSERQWGTVREDYSPGGDAWDYFPFEHSMSRVYRWGEDGIAGFSDDEQLICLSLALWNERDPYLKERLFGLANGEGNHGEDVKELYYYLDATPTHSYLKMLYKYPQSEYPYEALRTESRARTRLDPEYEILDTGIFDQDRYFDVFVEYAKVDVEDILIQITAYNRGPQPAILHLLPHIWFRNTWSWKPNASKPQLRLLAPGVIHLQHSLLNEFYYYVEGTPQMWFCDNETNVRKLFKQTKAQGFFKDAFHDYLIHGNREAVNCLDRGTKACAHTKAIIAPGSSHTVKARLTREQLQNPFAPFNEIFDQRRKEADIFYYHLQEEMPTPDSRNIQRQAYAGMIWTKQLFYYDVREWIKGDPNFPTPPTERHLGRNREWEHLNNSEIVSMPDKWEYPWYAAWDLAFHCIPLTLIDAEFAKEQLILLTREWYMHPNGQLPAYEWNFSDVNPPVHAWAAWRVYQIDRKKNFGKGDLVFLERVFHKLMLNFTWWVNRKDANDRNIFQGGFLGMDNIGIFNRSSKLPDGYLINQADGTSWMAMYCLNLMRIALELALHNRVYEDVATKFFEHFLFIAKAMTNMGGDAEEGVTLWDYEDDFYYDELSLPNGQLIPLKVRSMVGLIPLFAVETLEPQLLERLPDFRRRLEWFLNYRPDLARLISHWHEPGLGDRRLLSLLRGSRMKRLLKRMLSETEFLSDYGIRALSKVHKDEPYRFQMDGEELIVQYISGDSDSGLFGGNSNWRGPIWFPVNYLIIESLQKFHHYYGDDFKVECPTGSGQYLTIDEVANELACRLNRLFQRDEKGRRAVFGKYEKLQTDPHFKDYLLFYEYFDGDTGRGLGASHQTGWTGLIAKLLCPRRKHLSLISTSDLVLPKVPAVPY
jgi:hypothetical protein